MYGSWDMNFNRQDFFVILGNFLPFYPPNTLKNGNIKNKKTPEDIITFTSLPKVMFIRYTVPEIWLMTDVIVIFILGYTFP